MEKTPLANAIAEHTQNRGEPIPPDEELAANLVSFFEILLKAERENKD